MQAITLPLLILLFTTITTVSSQSTGLRVRNKVTVSNAAEPLTKLVIMLPLAQTNHYQSVSNVKLYDGTTVNIPETDDKYIRWIFTSDLPAPGRTKEIYYDFDILLNPIRFDFSRITAVYPYDTTSAEYVWYTGTSGIYVDPFNSTIQQIGSSVWTKSSGIVDYARRCYEYVAANFSYLNPNTGIHPLQDILAAGGGDCGNLSSIYISLLRYKNIPARHIITVRPDGSYHVWADFFLEKYGWIPVDVTQKQSTPSGDYFGRYDGSGIVLTKEVWLLLDKGDGDTYYASLLQTFHWWFWSSGSGQNIMATHTISSTTGTRRPPIVSGGNAIMYQRHSNGNIAIQNLFSNACIEKLFFLYDTKGRLVLQQPLSHENTVINTNCITKGFYVAAIGDGKQRQMSTIVIP